MACTFTAHRIAGESKVTLVHVLSGATDTGFGLLQGTSRVELVQDPAPPIPLTIEVWTPSAIVARLPAEAGNGGGKLRVVIAGTGSCTSDAEFGTVLGGIVSDLLTTVAVPEAAQAGDKVSLLNLLPGFTWQKTRHEPVKLVDGLAQETIVPPGNVIGWGGQRLQVTLPDEAALNMQLPVQSFLFKFGRDTQGVPIQIAKLPALDPALGTVVTPPLARAGAEIELYNALPGFVFDHTRHGDLRIRNPLVGTWRTLEVVQETWGTSRLRAILPTREQLGAEEEMILFQLQFTKSAIPINLAMEFSLFWKLQLHTLKCHDTEDSAGDDEPYLQVKVDQLLPVRHELEPLSEGEEATLNLPLLFRDKVTIKLFDDDTGVFGDDPDHLGTEVFGREEKKNDSRFFTLDGARYELIYDLHEVKLT